MAKRLLFGLLTITSIFLMTFASAGWFSDLFSKPELSPVDVGVQLTNSPPTIKKIFLPSALGPEYTQPFTGNPGTGFGLFYLGAVVEDANGPADLSQGTALPATSSIYFQMTSPANSINPSITRDALVCDSYACSNPLLGSNCDNPSIQLIYVCTGLFFAIDPPSSYSGASPNENDLWTLQVAAIDLAGNPSPTVSTGDAGFTNLVENSVQINELSAYNLATTALNWNSLSITTTNQPASAPLTIENFGNIPLTTIEITGADLTGTNPINPSATISVSAFSASGSSGGSPDASCVVPGSAVQLQDGAAVTVPGVSIPYTSAGPTTDRDQLFVCAYQQLNNPGILSGPSSTSYGGTWDIVAS